MKAKALCTLLLFVSLSASAFAERHWQSGTLTESRQEKVSNGSITTTNTDGRAKSKGNNKVDYSENSTSTTSNDEDNFQVYTIETAGKVYVVSQRLLFPWSKSANINVGEKVKFAVERNKVYIQDDDGKEYKTSIKHVKVHSEN